MNKETFLQKLTVAIEQNLKFSLTDAQKEQMFVLIGGKYGY